MCRGEGLEMSVLLSRLDYLSFLLLAVDAIVSLSVYLHILCVLVSPSDLIAVARGLISAHWNRLVPMLSQLWHWVIVLQDTNLSIDAESFFVKFITSGTERRLINGMKERTEDQIEY